VSHGSLAINKSQAKVLPRSRPWAVFYLPAHVRYRKAGPCDHADRPSTGLHLEFSPSRVSRMFARAWLGCRRGCKNSAVVHVEKTLDGGGWGIRGASIGRPPPPRSRKPGPNKIFPYLLARDGDHNGRNQVVGRWDITYNPDGGAAFGLPGQVGGSIGFQFARRALSWAGLVRFTIGKRALLRSRRLGGTLLGSSRQAREHLSIYRSRARSSTRAAGPSRGVFSPTTKNCDQPWTAKGGLARQTYSSSALMGAASKYEGGCI